MDTKPQVDVRELLKAGAHFGHKVSRWNPKMKPYIYGSKGGIYIIDLVKTADELTKALDFVARVVAGGKQVLFVGTKRHLKPAIKAAAEAASMPYVTERWFGGTLTNLATISKRVKHLKDLEEKLASGRLAETHNKRELGEVKVDMAKMNAVYSGLKDMDGLPGAVFVADVLTDQIAVKEASKLTIPVIGIVDTNSDPTAVDYPIPANDDAVTTVTLIANLMTQAVKHGGKLAKDTPAAKEEPVKPVEAVKASKSPQTSAKTDKGRAKTVKTPATKTTKTKKRVK